MSVDLGLERISRLLARTPLKWRAIHVAGTNGKGSTTAYASTMLDVYNRSHHRGETNGQSVLKHARFNSPHLVDPWDCISIDNHIISRKLYDHFGNMVRKRNEAEGIQATNFELLTATAFEIFTHQHVDVGVVEVGMGGRLDATNIIGQVAHELQPGEVVAERTPPLVTAVTRIGMDHQAFLGKSLKDIAREKAGIFKPGVPVVYDMFNYPDVRAVLERQAHMLKCEVLLPKDFSQDFERAIRTICDDRRLKPASSHIYGGNLSVACRAVCEALRQLGRMETKFRSLRNAASVASNRLANEMLHGAARETVYPGRLQRLDVGWLTGKEECEILLDGAHNPQSASMLSRHVWSLHHKNDGTPSRTPVNWILAFSHTKDVQEMLTELLQSGDKVFAVEFGPVADMPWVTSMNSAVIAEAAGNVKEVEVVHSQPFGTDVESAIKAASQESRPVVIAGSLYLVGDVLRILRDAKIAAQSEQRGSSAPHVSP